MVDNQVLHIVAEAQNADNQRKNEWREKALNILHATAKIKDLLREEEENEAPSNELRNMAELLYMDVTDLVKEFEDHGEDKNKWYFYSVIDDNGPIDGFGIVFDGFADLIYMLRSWDQEV